MNLQSEFPNEVCLLKKFANTHNITSDEWSRLNVIYSETEKYWQEAVKLIPSSGVKYLLIAEAPPWSEGGDIEYFYNPNAKSRSILNAVCRAFKIDRTDKSQADLLRNLSEKGFLLCDSLPFAINYSKWGKRGNARYQKLVSMTAESFLLRKKINNSGIRWRKELRIAFSVKLNALALIDHFGDELIIGNSRHRITGKRIAGDGATCRCDNIAVNSAYYPCADRLSDVFKLG